MTSFFQRNTEKVFHTLKRFPLPLLCSFLFCAISLITIKIGHFQNYDKYLSILSQGILWFLPFKLFTESKSWPQKYYYLIGALVFSLLAVWIYNFLPIGWTKTLLTGSFFLLLMVSPFLTLQDKTQEVWFFNYQVWRQILWVMIGTALLCGGVVSIFLSLQYLFSLKIGDSIQYSIILITTFLSPLVFMMGIPKDFSTPKDQRFPKVIHIFLSYIIIPLLLIYAGILYAYIIKIVGSWSLPRGKVAHMVSSFGSVGIMTYLISTLESLSEKKLIVFFRNHFFKILLGPLFLLAAGIGYRVREYGLTEPRYLIILCLLWLSLSTLFALMNKRRGLSQFIFISLSLLCISASFGPWSIKNLPLHSQVCRLKKMLLKNELLVDGHIKVKEKEISPKDQKMILSSLQYIINHKGSEKIKPWFSTLPQAKINTKKKYLNYIDIGKDIGFDISQKEIKEVNSY